MLSDKEKLEEELKLLKESLDLNVITKEEYETAKQRIEAKLDDLNILKQKNGEIEVKKEGEVKEDLKPEEKIEVREIKEEKVEPIEEEEKEEAKHEEEKIEETKIKEESTAKEEQKKIENIKEAEEKVTEELKEEKVVEEIEEGEKEELGSISKPEDEQPEIISEEETKIDKKIFVYISIIVILILGLWYVFFLEKADVEDVSAEPADNILSLIACNSDDDCMEKGKIGVCNNPGEENAECEYIEDVKVELMVLNSNNCFNCETGRVLSILDGFFPNLDVENIDFENVKGTGFIANFGINALPAYIFNLSFKEAYNYDKLSSSFNKVDDSFVMKNTVANANYYVEREEIPNKLDLFFSQGQTASTKAEENLKEFLEVFDSEVEFEKHNEDSEIVKELGINTFPAFLVNNKIKFGGVQPADKIRENFCQLNSVTECASGLTKSLV